MIFVEYIIFFVSTIITYYTNPFANKLLFQRLFWFIFIIATGSEDERQDGCQ